MECFTPLWVNVRFFFFKVGPSPWAVTFRGVTEPFFPSLPVWDRKVRGSWNDWLAFPPRSDKALSQQFPLEDRNMTGSLSELHHENLVELLEGNPGSMGNNLTKKFLTHQLLFTWSSMIHQNYHNYRYLTGSSGFCSQKADLGCVSLYLPVFFTIFALWPRFSDDLRKVIDFVCSTFSYCEDGSETSKVSTCQNWNWKSTLIFHFASLV